MSGQLKKTIFTIDAIRVIMDPLNWNDPNVEYDYDVMKILNRHKYIHVFFYEIKDHWFWDIKFEKSLIDSVKNWLQRKQE